MSAPNPNDYVNCTVATCPLATSYYNYRMNIAANAAFVGLFSIALIWFSAVWIYTRRGFWFTLAMLLGIITEIIGYAARIVSWRNQWNQNAFLAQIICITIGPAFLSAGMYLCLGRIVVIYGEENSRLPHKWYTRIFIPCDILSLVLQAVGGGLASVALTENKSLDTGDDIMIAGLVFQVFTLVIFIGLCTDFALRVHRRVRKVGATAAMPQDLVLSRIRDSRQFKGFTIALGLATILVLWRCAYRVAELNQGWSGPVTFKQGLYIGFEPVLITAAVYSLAAFHPAFCMREALGQKLRLKFKPTKFKEVKG